MLVGGATSGVDQALEIDQKAPGELKLLVPSAPRGGVVGIKLGVPAGQGVVRSGLKMKVTRTWSAVQ